LYILLLHCSYLMQNNPLVLQFSQTVDACRYTLVRLQKSTVGPLSISTVGPTLGWPGGVLTINQASERQRTSPIYKAKFSSYCSLAFSNETFRAGALSLHTVVTKWCMFSER
jgi:hypothetical protein